MSKKVWFRYTGKFEIVKTGKIIEVEDCAGHPYYAGIKLYPGPSEETDYLGEVYVKQLSEGHEGEESQRAATPPEGEVADEVQGWHDIAAALAEELRPAPEVKDENLFSITFRANTKGDPTSIYHAEDEATNRTLCGLDVTDETGGTWYGDGVDLDFVECKVCRRALEARGLVKEN